MARSEHPDGHASAGALTSESGAGSTAVSASGRDPAPGDLALVQAFVNTLDLGDDATDSLTDINALRRWFVSQGLLGPRDRLRDGDLERATAVREALRQVLAFHNGLPLRRGALTVLNRAAATAPVTVALDPEGRAALAPAGQGLDVALGRLFAIIERATAEGTWRRLKACPDDDCLWAFYDRSRNRSGTWCAMRVCGNRAKARSFRERRRTGDSR